MPTPIPPSWDLPAELRERFGTRAGRQRTMFADGHLVIVLHAVPDPAEPDVRHGHLFWRRPDGTWQSSGSAATSIALLRAHVESYDAAADELEALVDRATCADDWFAILGAAAPLMRSARNMSKALQAARELVPGDRELIGVRDQAQEIERAAELLHAHGRDGLDFTVARNSEESARNSQHVIDAGHRLNLITAMFLPITALGSLLGINLVHGFERWHQPYTFWVVAALAFTLGLVVRGSLPKPQRPTS
ncbi:MAG: hypothetical protein IPL61_00810 [Myxococcales bacterium]|nr:hypothetical protein [Myxococcales bacterium]